MQRTETTTERKKNKKLEQQLLFLFYDRLIFVDVFTAETRYHASVPHLLARNARSILLRARRRFILRRFYRSERLPAPLFATLLHRLFGHSLMFGAYDSRHIHTQLLHLNSFIVTLFSSLFSDIDAFNFIPSNLQEIRARDDFHLSSAEMHWCTPLIIWIIFILIPGWINFFT